MDKSQGSSSMALRGIRPMYQVVEELPIEFDVPSTEADPDDPAAPKDLVEINAAESGTAKHSRPQRQRNRPGYEEPNDIDPLEPAPPQPSRQTYKPRKTTTTTTTTPTSTPAIVQKPVTVNRYPCGFCDTVFTDSSFLVRHHKRCKVKRIQESTGVVKGPGPSGAPVPLQRYTAGRGTLYSCHLCSFSTKNPDHLKYHRPIHADDKPFECEECHFTCRELEQLNAHKKTHAGYKEFTYVEDGSNVNQLEPEKEQEEGGGKLFSCDQCSYTSTRGGYLIMHKRIHKRVEPFVCNECGYKCTRLAYFKRHKLTHEAANPLVCKRCGVVCNSQNELQKHQDECTAEPDS